jgi:hypothetical protein
MSLHRLVRQNGGRIVFCEVDPTVAEVFRVSHLESLFDFVRDRTTALRAIVDHPGPDKQPVEHDPDRPRPNRPRPGLSRLRRRSSEADPH